MPDKPNTNKKEEQASKSNDEIRIANATLREAIVMANESIAEAQSFIDKTEKDVDILIKFLVDTCVERSAGTISESDGMKAVEEELSKHFTNTADILKYKDHASRICNAVLQSTVGGSDDRSITVSAFLNRIAKELDGTDVVEVTINSNRKYAALGTFLNKGVRMYVDGSVGGGLANNLRFGEVNVNGGVHGKDTAFGMTGGILDMYGKVEGFHLTAFSYKNKGKIYLHHPTRGQVLIYDGTGDYTKAAKDFFDIKYKRNFYTITPK